MSSALLACQFQVDLNIRHLVRETARRHARPSGLVQSILGYVISDFQVVSSERAGEVDFFHHFERQNLKVTSLISLA